MSVSKTFAHREGGESSLGIHSDLRNTLCSQPLCIASDNAIDLLRFHPASLKCLWLFKQVIELMPSSHLIEDIHELRIDLALFEVLEVLSLLMEPLGEGGTDEAPMPRFEDIVSIAGRVREHETVF